MQRWGPGPGPEVSLPTSGGPSGFLRAEALQHHMRWPGEAAMCSSAEFRLTSSAITLETGEFPAGKIKMILPGWLKKRPQQGAGKGINKHGSSRHSQALLGLAPRLEEAPEGLEGRSPTWGGWGEGRGLASRLRAQGLSRRHQPALPLRGGRAPRGLAQPPRELRWRSYSYTDVPVSHCSTQCVPRVGPCLASPAIPHNGS